MISIVIPCFNNEAELPKTVSKILECLGPLPQKFEIVLVDDGSRDKTWSVIQRLSKELNTATIKGIRLEANIGAYSAIVTGMTNSSGDSILIMAADGDDPPEIIPELVALFDSQTQLVMANKKSSDKDFASVLLSHVFILTLKLLGAKNIPLGGSDFMLFSRELFTQCAKNGWKNGNTLIQLIQHARHYKSVDYLKGKSKPSTWTFIKKLTLFYDTVVLFLSLSFLRRKLPEAEVIETC